MEVQEQELVKRLIEEDEVFRKAYREHREYENMLAKLEKKSALDPRVVKEKASLKKKKLALKDEMEHILAKHKRRKSA